MVNHKCRDDFTSLMCYIVFLLADMYVVFYFVQPFCLTTEQEWPINSELYKVGCKVHPYL